MSRALAAVFLALVTAAVLGAVTMSRARAVSAVDADREQAVAVAEEVVRDFITVNGQNVREKVDLMQRVSTEPFRSELTKFATAFGAILTQGQVQASGRVDFAGVERIDDKAATVLVSASTTVRNTEVPNGVPRNFRLVVGLLQEDDAWRVASVEVAP